MKTGTDSNPPFARTLAATLAAWALIFLPASPAANLQWDADPTTEGLQDGGGQWSNLAGLTNWWDGAQNAPWSAGDTAVIGANLVAANATITLTNPIVAGGVIFSNAPDSANRAYTIAAAAGANLSLIGSPASIVSAVNYPPGAGTAADVISASLVATGGLQVTAATPPTWQAQISFNNASNYFGGTLEIGTPGNDSYETPTALMAQFNSAGIGSGSLTGCTNLTVHTNAGIFFRGGSGAFTLNLPKKFILSGDGIPSSSFCFGSLIFSGNNGTVFPADIELAGDSSVVGIWGVNATITNSGSISGTGRLRYCNSRNRNTFGTVVFTGVHTYVGDTIFDGGITIVLASGANDRLPASTALKLGTTGIFYAGGQSSYNSYGRLILGDTLGAVNQTLAGLENDPTLNAGNTACWVVGGNSTSVSTLTINNSTDFTYNSRLGGPASPDNMLGLVKSGVGTLNLQGINQCAGGYTINGGTLVFGDGFTDSTLSGPITNNAALVINAAGNLTYAETITGSGSFTKDGAGTLTLTGTHAVRNATFVQSGKLVLNTGTETNASISVAPGVEMQVNRAASTSTVNAASLSLDSATLDLDLNFSATATPPFRVAGAFINNGATTITLLRSGVLSVGGFPLIQYGSYQSNAFSSLSLAPIAGVTASIQNNPDNQSIDLVVTAITGHQVKWSGATDANWDTTTTNWLDAGLSPATYANNDFALFDDSATGPTALQITSDPQPSTLTISNQAKAYSFTGAGLTSPSALVKQGAGTATIATTFNTASGTQIQGGTLQVGDGSTDGTVTSPILDNGSLVLNVLSVSSYADVSGTGAVTKAGSGQLNLSGNSTYEGATTVQDGTLYVQSSSALGATNGGTTVLPGAELWLDADGLNLSEPLTIGGQGVGGAGAALNNSATALNSTLTGDITVTTDTDIITASATTLNLTGPINAGANTLVVRPNSGAVINVSNTLSAAAVLLNNSGTLRLTASNNLNHTAVLLPAGLWVLDSQALGASSTVGITNSITPGGPTANVLLGNNVTIPAGVSLFAEAPAGAANAFRTALSFGTAESETNTWNGHITVTGPDVLSTGLPGYFTAVCNNGRAILNGDITVPPGQTANFQLRGVGVGGIVNGRINLDTNNFTRAQTTPWTIASAGNTWNQTVIFQGRLLLGTNEALPANALLRLDDATCILDLNGFTQHVPSLTNNGNANWGSVANSSTNAASTLVYEGGDSFFGGSIATPVGTQPLHLDVVGGVLTLSAANTYSGTTTIRSGATLALVGSGTVSGTALIDVQAGGVFDLSGAGSFTVGFGQTLRGNGTVAGNLPVDGTLAPGGSIGTLTVGGDVSLNSSAMTLMEVNNSAGTNDHLNASGAVSYGGTLLIENVSATPYTVNQVVKLFQAAQYNGTFANIVFPGAATFDASLLNVDGTIKVLMLVSTTPVDVSFATLGGTNLQLSWPSDHTGWRLLAQTNNLSQGISTNPADWGVVLGSQSTNVAVVPLDGTKPAEFYRLVYP